jgi:hypothetical protein
MMNTNNRHNLLVAMTPRLDDMVQRTSIRESFKMGQLIIHWENLNYKK